MIIMFIFLGKEMSLEPALSILGSSIIVGTFLVKLRSYNRRVGNFADYQNLLCELWSLFQLRPDVILNTYQF